MAQQSKKARPGIMAADDVRKVGMAVGGTYWQSDLAMTADYSKSMITRVLNGTRRCDAILGTGLQKFVTNKLTAIAKVLDTPGLTPLVSEAKIKRAQDLIAQAVELMQS